MIKVSSEALPRPEVMAHALQTHAHGCLQPLRELIGPPPRSRQETAAFQPHGQETEEALCGIEGELSSDAGEQEAEINISSDEILDPQAEAYLLHFLAQKYRCQDHLRELIGPPPQSQRVTAEHPAAASHDQEMEEALCGVRNVSDGAMPAISSGGEIMDDDGGGQDGCRGKHHK